MHQASVLVAVGVECMSTVYTVYYTVYNINIDKAVLLNLVQALVLSPVRFKLFEEDFTVARKNEVQDGFSLLFF